ncbi:MAG: UDP-2,4-diacetamido-2,4,6-trideoxy-beta-L-altropyranose hydrolase [Candidatus Thermoplasmatota archaeon]|nr:UDP-2,4-diacetamido-2,4,6-trideoxy-beta-L-altropyranose hydrolase [Candidatus Thermoplasmatota archaeon]
MNIAFRVDASPDIGLGHLMRCLALSEELKNRGHYCLFFTKTNNPEVINRIKAYHHDSSLIPAFVSIQQDRDMLISYAQDQKIDWVVTDHYGIDASYIQVIKQRGFYVLSIDDTAQIHYYSDIIVNQNICAEKLEFSTEPYTIPLLGPSYVMLRDELLVREKKKYHTKVKKLLLLLGGSDSQNYILTILQSIANVIQNIELLVVIGPFNPHKAILQAYAEETDLPINCLYSPKNMAEYYLQADLAISAGGSSCYELAYFGIPSLIITVANNQRGVAYGFHTNRIGLYLGEQAEIKPEHLRDKVKELVEDKSLRDRMRQNGMNLVDGKGKAHIVDSMERIACKKK